jgi:hypothetical protein
LRNEREELLPDNTSPAPLELTSLIMKNNNNESTDASEAETIAAAAAKQMTTMFLSMAKRI